MKATLGWLREFVEIELDPAELAERLTNTGLECTVELEGSIEGVVVGEVLDVTPHPKADRLKVCKVLAGSEVLSIVCGAPNAQVGIKAPLAMLGSHLPGGMAIEAAEIRGVRSEGMLCSEAELEVGEDASGLWILPSDLTPGESVDQVLGLRDVVFEFELTPNRGDCLSILGLAYEIAAVSGVKVRPPEISMKESGVPIGERFQVIIRDPDLCPRYVARMVEGTQVGPSPFWMRRRLQLVGIRPINNLVDVTNYVMWELGQPLHAFDLELLEKERIVVQRAREGEVFVSLDGQERHLTTDMLMIWDGVKPVAVAGVMGGENSEVRPDSRSILIESALFDPSNIRRTAKALGMATEASRRFERGVDSEGSPRAADRAAQLMAELAGGTIAPGLIDAHPAPKQREWIPLRINKVNQLLGTDLRSREVRSLLERLELKVEDEPEGSLRVLPPARRVDLTREVDLIEEVARIWGYDRIPSTLPRTSTVSVPQDLDQRMESLVREILVGFGFYEIITYVFMDRAALDLLELEPKDALRGALPLRNPIRWDHGVMRTTLLPGILDTVRRNLLRRNTDLRLFELGRVFFPMADEALPAEPRRVGGAMLGARLPEHWGARREPMDLFDLKGVLEAVFSALQIPDMIFDAQSPAPFFGTGTGTWICRGEERIGCMGELNSRVLEAWDLEAPVFVFELDFERMTESAQLERRFHSLPRYPEVVRDLSIIVDQGVPAGQILEGILQTGLDWLQEAYLFDIFAEDEKIPRGMKSLTFRIRYRSRERNLTDEEVNAQQERLIERLHSQFGARLRPS